MTINLVSFLPQLEPLTPDGRWRLLQNWLDSNPDFKKPIEAWVDAPVDDVFPELREVAARWFEDKYGTLAGALARTAELTPELAVWISTLQTCYKERKRIDKEIKHGRRNNRRNKAGV